MVVGEGRRDFGSFERDLLTLNISVNTEGLES